MNVEIPFAPRRALGSSVRTMIIIRSAVPAFVAHAFVPFSTQSLPSFTACARSDAASEPASASESANPASNSPRAMALSQRCFCSGVPCFTSIVVGIALWIPTETARAASAAEISSSTMRYVSVSSAMPSYSSGVHMPKKPSLPSSSNTPRGKCLVLSHSAANGSIFSLANSRASSTTCSRTSVAVDIEPLPRFSAELSFGDHFLEQRRRPVLLLVEPVLQHLHDGEAHVEADQIGERQRPERVIHAELHHLIDRFRSRDALVYAEDRFVDHRHQHAVRHESRRVIHFNRSLSQRLYDFHGSLYGVVRRLLSTYYLDEFHDGHGVHEMHPDDPVGTPGLLGDFRDRNRRSVGREDRALRGQTIQALKDVELGVGILGGCFDDKIDVFHRIERRARLNPAESFCSLLLAPRSLFHQASNVCLDNLQPAGEHIVRDIDHRDAPPMLREDVRDAIAHRPGAHHGHFAHAATTSLKASFRVTR